MEGMASEATNDSAIAKTLPEPCRICVFPGDCSVEFGIYSYSFVACYHSHSSASLKIVYFFFFSSSLFILVGFRDSSEKKTTSIFSLSN